MKILKLTAFIGLSLFFSAAFAQQSNTSTTNSTIAKGNTTAATNSGADKYRAELAARKANPPATVKGEPEKGRKEGKIKLVVPPPPVIKKPDSNVKNQQMQQQAQPQGK